MLTLNRKKTYFCLDSNWEIILPTKISRYHSNKCYMVGHHSLGYHVFHLDSRDSKTAHRQKPFPG